MRAENFNLLWSAIDVLEAQEHLALINAIQYPKLTKAARAEKTKTLSSTAYPRHIYKRESKDAGFLISKLGGKNGRQ
jgi:hypothetical protein